jgi:DNA-binding XRE family transcriptional regulator
MTITEVRIQRQQEGGFAVLYLANSNPQKRPFPDRGQARWFVRVELVKAGLPRGEARRVLAQEASRQSLLTRSNLTNARAEDFGRTLQLARQAKGLSLRDAARSSGISPSGLSLIERGRRTPSHPTLEAVARAYGIAIAIDPDGTRVGPREEGLPPSLAGARPRRKPPARHTED